MRAAGEKISIKEYALTYGLNPNTARRYLGKALLQLGKVQDQRSADQIVKKEVKRSNDQKSQVSAKAIKSPRNRIKIYHRKSMN